MGGGGVHERSLVGCGEEGGCFIFLDLEIWVFLDLGYLNLGYFDLDLDTVGFLGIEKRRRFGTEIGRDASTFCSDLEVGFLLMHLHIEKGLPLSL